MNIATISVALAMLTAVAGTLYVERIRPQSVPLLTNAQVTEKLLAATKCHLQEQPWLAPLEPIGLEFAISKRDAELPNTLDLQNFSEAFTKERSLLWRTPNIAEFLGTNPPRFIVSRLKLKSGQVETTREVFAAERLIGDQRRIIELHVSPRSTRATNQEPIELGHVSVSVSQNSTCIR